MSKKSGFTLIELMIVVAIVSILAAVALPSYKNYLIRGRIPDATSALATKRVKMEQWYQDNRTYVGADGGAGLPATLDTTTSKYFDFSGTNLTASGYTLTATGKGPMAGFSYTVDQANSKTTTITGVSGGWDTTATCWVIRSGGQC